MSETEINQNENQTNDITTEKIILNRKSQEVKSKLKMIKN